MSALDNEGRDQQLWCAVILQAIEDATPSSLPRGKYALLRARHQAETARAWLTGHSRGFLDVCAMAGLEPDQVRKGAIARIAECETQIEPTPKSHKHMTNAITQRAA